MRRSIFENYLMERNHQLLYLILFLPITCYGQHDWIFPFYENGLYGYTNSSADTVVPAIFQEASATMGKLGVIKFKGKYGYINNEGEIAIKPKFDSATQFYRGFSSAKKHKRTYGFHENGERVTHSIALCGKAYCYEPGWGKESIFLDSYGKKGLVYQRYYLNSKTFGMDTLKPEFDSIFPIGHQLLGMMKNNKFAILYVQRGMNSPQSIKDNMKFIYDDIKLFECASDYQSKTSYEPILGYKQGNLWGYFSTYLSGRILTEAKYLTISSLAPGYALVEFSENRFGYVDESGNEYFDR